MADLFLMLKEELKKRNISLSYQRLKIVEYLAQHLCHPTVEQIYTHLVPSIPTLSKTTVYNTLRMLVEVGLVKIIDIEEHEARYDIEVGDHGHFKCLSCGCIFNFYVDMDTLSSEDLKLFEIKEKNVYFSGVCPHCRNK